MHKTVQNLIDIQNKIHLKLKELNFINYSPNIIAVSKTFGIEHLMPIIEHGHIHFGENKVQESVEKWTNIKLKKNHIKLHMIGKLQTNKVKFAVKLFDYIHSVDNLKLAKKISEEQKKVNKKVKIFIQINIGNEDQKSGININDAYEFSLSCVKLGLDIVGTMCLPPDDGHSDKYFSIMQKINNDLGLKEMSMGMSNDYLNAIEFKSSFLRIGTKIFGERS
jgi:pyridoxal phosphate enzyme (YggS family)|tara:strand:+ start:8618 stop:9280 length:663 start_codon:yes stop_codon:yes gene_type:complete